MITFPIIDADGYYTEQLLPPLPNNFDSYIPLLAYAKFLLDNKVDPEMVNWFPELVRKLDEIKLADFSNEHFIQIAAFIEKVMIQPDWIYHFVIRSKSRKEIVGFIHFQKQIHLDCCEALELYLNANYRGQNIMPKILDGLISCLLKNDVTSIKVVVNANNGNSLKFIIKNGFQEIPSKLKSEDNIDYYKYFIKEF